MKIRVLGAFGSEGLGQRPSAFLLDDRILLDAGTVTGALTVPEQVVIEHALLSHSHLDHVAGLAFLAETLAYGGRKKPLTLAGAEPVVDALRTGVFNNIVWPDFSALPAGAPVLKFRSLVEDAEQRVGDLWVTPVRVNHTVPATGFIVHDGETGLIYSGDTGPTDALWKAARGQPGLRAVILECAFPSRMHQLATLAKHMTPELIRRELDKLPPDTAIWVFHVKPQFYDEIATELSTAVGDRVTLLEQDATYTV
jgi:ribonuclease BN (tRNA processing enzyme)